MCGRFFLDVDFDDILSQYDINTLEGMYENRYEIFPTQPVVSIVNRKGVKKAVPMDWGIQTPYIKRPIINARAETVSEKKLFATAIQNRRCIVPASGYFEWHTTDDAKKVKTKIWLPGQPLVGLAGIYNVYQVGQEKKVMVSLLTLDAQEAISHIHDRMPLIVPLKDTNTYLNDDHFTLATYMPMIQGLKLAYESL